MWRRSKVKTAYDNTEGCRQEQHHTKSIGGGVGRGGGGGEGQETKRKDKSEKKTR